MGLTIPGEFVDEEVVVVTEVVAAAVFMMVKVRFSWSTISWNGSELLIGLRSVLVQSSVTIDPQRQREMLTMRFIDSLRATAGSRWVMGMMILLRVMSRSDRWCSTVPGDRWWEPLRGILAWNREMDPRGGGLRTRKAHWGWHRRLVIEQQSKGKVGNRGVSPMVSERDWTLKWAGAGA